MPQVSQSEIIPQAVGKLEISTDSGTTWTDASGYGFKIEVAGGNRMSGEAYTHDGDTALIGVGKREPIEITFSGLYTEDAQAPFTTIWAEYLTYSGGFMVRYCPKEGVTGDVQYTSDICVVTSCLPPSTDPASGDPTPFVFTVKTASLTRGEV